MATVSLTGIDVGSPRLPGRTRQLADGYEVVAGGTDIWGETDEFHFAQVRVTGDFVLAARLESLAMADRYTKAGLMLRASPSGASEHAYLLAFGDNQERNKNNGGLEFQFRERPNGPSVGVYPPQPLPVHPDFPVNFPDVWLRLTRTGAQIKAESSPDGRTWRIFCGHRQALPAAVHLGLAVTSHHPDKTVRAFFSSLVFSGERL